MKTEQYIQKLIDEGKIDADELNELIARESAKNPIPALQVESASLLMSSVLMEGKLQQVESDQATLFMELIMQGVI